MFTEINILNISKQFQHLSVNSVIIIPMLTEVVYKYKIYDIGSDKMFTFSKIFNENP